MGCATTTLGPVPDGFGDGLELDPPVSRNARAPQEIQKFLASYPSRLPERRLRPAKSYTLQHKKRRGVTESIPRSRSAETRFLMQKGSTTLFSPVGSPKRGGRLVKLPENPLPGSDPIARSQARVRLEILLVKEAEQRSSDGLRPRVDQQLLSGGLTFGRYETLRRILVEFILTISPPPPLRHGRDDLRDQLSSSPDTRFAAAYLMTRFWFLCEVGDYTLEWKGFVDYGWQLAIACIGLCVRMQRDFLPPLRPVTNKELILLAPQGIDVTVHDLEQAQRDILKATSYSLQGNTPQPFLEEFRCSLPMFQLLATTNPVEDLTRNFWARMFDALLQRDVLFAPISILAAAVLVSISPAERAATFREEVCDELKITKREFGRVSVWFEGVENAFE